MNEFVYIIFYLVLSLIFIFFIWKNNKKLGLVGMYSGLIFGFLLYYAIVPLIAIIKMDDLIRGYSGINEFILLKDPFQYYYSICAIFVGFIFFHISYNISFKKNVNANELILKDYDKDKSIRIFSYIGYLCLFIGGGTLVLFFNSLGGIASALAVAEENRSFSTELTQFTNYGSSLLIVPARLITVAPFVFLFLIFSRRNLFDKLFFVISFSLTILYFIFYAGRAPLIGFLLCFLYFFLRYFSIKVWRKVIILGVMALPLLDIMDRFFIYLNTKVWNPFEFDYLKYINQFIHPFKNTLNMADIVDLGGYRYGADYITAFLNLLPGVNFSVSYEKTSEYYSGTYWKFIGGTPNDIITFSYIEFGLLGFMLIPAVMGYIFGKIDRSLRVFPNSKVKNLLAAALCINSFFIVASADFEAILRGSLILIFISFIVLKSVKTKKH